MRNVCTLGKGPMKVECVSGVDMRAYLGEITTETNLFGLTNGRFGLADIIEHVLRSIGPAHMLISTWTANNASIDKIFWQMSSHDVLSVRFLVDHSFPQRQPAFYTHLTRTFGLDSVIIMRLHAKFVVFHNDKYDIVLRTSMNLNKNARVESFELSNNPTLVKFISDFFDVAFTKNVDGVCDLSAMFSGDIDIFKLDV